MTLTTPAQAYEAGIAEGFRQALDCAAAVAEIEPRALLPAGDGVPTLAQLGDRLALIEPERLAILRPFDAAEAISSKEAAAVAGRHVNTIGEWVERYRIGRLVVGRQLVSKVALAMLLDGDAFALALLLSGRREDPTVVAYMRRAGLG